MLWIIMQMNAESIHGITRVTQVTQILAYMSVFCFFLITEYLFSCQNWWLVNILPCTLSISDASTFYL